MLVLSRRAMVSLVVARPPTDSIHAETSDHSRTLLSLLHAELSQGQFECHRRLRSPVRHTLLVPDQGRVQGG